MNDSSEVHPDEVLNSLLSKGGRSNRRAHLSQMHQLCRKHSETGSRDFSLPTIGRLAEAEHIMKGRALYNAQSSDYRALIEAWAFYSGPPEPKRPKPPKPIEGFEFLMRIQDPAIRAKVQIIIAENRDLKAQLNTLKGATKLNIIRRPGERMRVTESQPAPAGATTASASPTQSPEVLPPLVELTRVEQEALRKSVSSEYLALRGLREGSAGEILDQTGRTMFDVRFTHAVRKLLAKNAQPHSFNKSDTELYETVEITECNPASGRDNARQRGPRVSIINHS